MREQILNYCRKEINKFSTMSDTEIYNWMCDNFYTKDYEMIRQCSMQIFKESRKI